MVGDKIREFRKEIGMTQQCLADKLNVHRVTVAKWESGDYSPRLSTLEKICEALDKELKDFFVK